MMPAAAGDSYKKKVFRPFAGVMLAAVLALSGSLVVSLQPGVARAADPSITIVSPDSASGPVETHMQIEGDGWDSGANVRLYYNQPADSSKPCGDPADAPGLADQHPFGSGLVNAENGSWLIETVQWPDNTGTGQFYICGFEGSSPDQVVASDQPFNVLSTTPPALDPPQPAFPNIGDQVTISGRGFLPGNQPVDLWLAQSLNNPTQGTSLGTATPDGSGSFTQQVTLPTNLSGNLSIVALSHPSTNDAPPPLVASVDVTVGATASTPTVTPTGSATADPTAEAQPTTPATTGTGDSSGSSASKAILTILVVLLTLVILAIFGVLIWYFMGIRPPADGAPVRASPTGRTRPPLSSPQRGPARRPSQADWQEDEDWEDLQGPWEEDDQGGWGDTGYTGQYGPGTATWPADPPRPGSSRDEWRNRSRPGSEGW